MREIKFRVWDEEKFVNLGEAYDKDLISIDRGNENYLRGEFEDVIIQQFTGLKDKNGKEIYEGDIVNTTARGICEIIWNENENAFRLGKYNEMPLSILTLEVIGNIFENPELINKP